MTIGLVGYGKMGKSAFNLFSGAGLDVAVVVRTPEQAARFQLQYERRVARRLGPGRAGDGPAPPAGTAVFSADPGILRGCELVLESVPEDPGLKQDVLRSAEAAAGPEAVLASNTSSLSLAGLADGLSRPERVCGFHLIHPVPLTSVVEIVAWDGVSARAIETVAALARRLGRRPIIVRDCPGPALNPVLGCYICEALYILEQGLAMPRDLDRLAEREFRVGPCESLDIVGVSLYREIFERTASLRPACVPLPSLVTRLLADGRTGREAGRGLYVYGEDPPGQSPAAYYKDADQRHSLGGAAAGEALLERLMLFIQEGALYILALGKADPDDLDAGLQDAFGLVEGPIARMRRLGRDGLRRRLEKAEREIGPRFAPALAEHLP